MERIYNIPLRKEYQKAPSYKHSSKAMRAIKEFILKHTKADDVKVGKYLNQLIWKNGPKNPPHKVNVKVVVEEKIAKVELVDAPVEEVKEEKKKPAAKKEKIEKEVKEEVKEELEKEGLKEEVAEKVAEEVVEESGEEIVEEVTEAKPKKSAEKVPTALELAKKKEKKETKKVPTVAELAKKKSSK